MIAAIVLTAAVMSRTVVVAQPGAHRLDPDSALLSGTSSPLRYSVTTDKDERRFAFAGGLEDLRLHDASGRELQYLMVSPHTGVQSWRTARSILAIPSTKIVSGIEADFGSPITIDRVRINGVQTPFLKRVHLDGSGDREHWTVLAAEATVFDLPEQELKNLEVSFAPGDYRYVRFVWDDRSSARVRAVSQVSGRISQRVASEAPVTIAVSFRKIASEAYKSRYRISLPGPHLPVAAIDLRVTNANVFRDASVSEPRFNGSALVPATLGTGKLRRAERDGAVATQMAIPISFPAGADLELVVDDGDAGSLNIDSIAAQLAPLPWIYFETTNAGSVTATYGNASLHAPRYDLEASRGVIARSQPPLATWAAGIENVRSEAATADALPTAGAPIDRTPFKRSRSIGGAPRGLTSLLLDADVQAHSNGLDDVRLVDQKGRQVPYVVEKRDAPLLIELHIPPRKINGTASIYRFDLPYDRFPAGTRLLITTRSRVFERDVQVQRPADESHGRDADVLERTTWRSTDPESAPPSLTFSVPLTTNAVELRVDERDNAPLPISSAQLLLPSFALRFFGSGTPLTLLYDDPSAAAPHYDLALLTPRLLTASAREIVIPASAALGGPSSHNERMLFWSVICVAIIALLATLARLLRSDEAKA